jgi:tRNA nucleotidyltransferase/poly(A) polymerase
MNLSEAIANDPIFEALAAVRDAGQQAYLVGGCVRDLLLGRSLHDLDFVISRDAGRLARKVANRLKGAYFVLDEAFDAARVIYSTEAGERMTADFTGYRAADLEGDLRARDFTINAIALDLQQPDQLIDPLGGAQHLRQRVLRACSPDSIQADPVRVLRGVRFATHFGLRIDPQTLAWLRIAKNEITRSSPERLRDELFKLLDYPRPAASIRILDALGALEPLLPELLALKGVEQSAPHTLDVYEHTLAALDRFEGLWDVLVGEYRREATDLTLGLAVRQLGRFRYPLQEHLGREVSNERSLRSVLMFALLYHDIAKPQTKVVTETGRTRFITHDQIGAEATVRRAEALVLSRAEIELLRTLVRQHMRIHLLAQTDQEISRRAIYRYFQATGTAGVDICLLSLADTLATYGPTLPVETWEAELEVARTLLEAWFERKEELVAPPRLVDGNDLMTLLNLPPGRMIGELLALIREKQAEGVLTSREQILGFAAQWGRQRGNIVLGEEES